MDETKEEYPLARGYRAAARLNLQHYIWKQSNGYLTHPDIALKPGFKIADVGTGTGIWLTDLADSHSDVQLHGFDTDISQCPPSQWLPGNVSISKLDIFDEIPHNLRCQYDVINVRFFLCVVKDSNPEAVLQQLMIMLKPGGWIQWTEQDIKTCKVIAANPDASIVHTEALKEFAMNPTPKFTAESQYWVADLHKTFTTAGLLGVKEDRSQRAPWTLSSSHDSTMLAMEEMSLRLPNGPGVRAMIAKASQEFEDNQRGIAIVSDKITVYGRKPEM